MVAAYAVEAELLGVADFVPLHRGVDRIARAESVFLGAFAEGALVAVAELEAGEAGATNVASLVVLPERFREGLGTALMREAIERHGARGLTVSTGIRNAPALALYARLGFRDHRRWETEDGIPMVTLRLTAGGGDRTRGP